MADLTIKHGGTTLHLTSHAMLTNKGKLHPKMNTSVMNCWEHVNVFFFQTMVKVLQPFAVPHVGTHLEGQGMVAMNLEVWR